MRLRDYLYDQGYAKRADDADSWWYLWEYSDQMQGGDQIHDEVINTVNSVRLAVICFSDATVEAPWIDKEANWCVFNQKSKDRQLKHIVPVWVGPHPKNGIPKGLHGLDLAVADASQGTDEQLRGVAEAIRKGLKDQASIQDQAPIVVPAALFALDEDRCTKLFEDWDTAKDDPSLALRNLCFAMGMPEPPNYQIFRKRYGPKVEDFAPFELDTPEEPTGTATNESTEGLPAPESPVASKREPLITTINKVLRSVNLARTTSTQHQRPPIALRWLHRQFSESGNPATNPRMREAADLWLANESLLVVDSISMLLPEIRQVVQDLPETVRSSLLWIPPYTQHTARSERALERSAYAVRRIGTELNRLKIDQQPRRSITFDAGTPLAVHVWLRRMLTAVESTPEPIEQTVDAIRKAAGGRVRINEMTMGK